MTLGKLLFFASLLLPKWGTEVVLAQKNSTPIKYVEQQLTEIETAKSSVTQKVRKSKLLYFLGKYSSPEEKQEAIYRRALKLIEDTKKKHPDHPGVLMWWVRIKSAVVLIEGKLTALRSLGSFEKALLAALKADPTYAHYGPHRALGVLYDEAPSLFSIGSGTKARLHLRTAYEKAPNYPGNVVEYAAYLYREGDENKGRKLAAEIDPAQLKKYSPIDRYEWATSLSKIK